MLAMSAAGIHHGAWAGTPGDDMAEARNRMMEHDIRGRGVTNAAVLAAVGRVPRHRFVLPAFRDQSYGDHPLPIGHNQTISQPYIVAAMTELLEVRPGHRIFEVGTGSGYQAAVLAEVGAEVYTVEIVPELAAQATGVLKELGYEDVHVRAGDGYAGWPEHAPFDGVMVTCGADRIPEPLVEQLAVGGRMVIPVGPSGGIQSLLVGTKKEDGTLETRTVMAVRFVPMTGDGIRGAPETPPHVTGK